MGMHGVGAMVAAVAMAVARWRWRWRWRVDEQLWGSYRPRVGGGEETFRSFLVCLLQQQDSRSHRGDATGCGRHVDPLNCEPGWVLSEFYTCWYNLGEAAVDASWPITTVVNPLSHTPSAPLSRCGGHQQ